MRTIKKLFLPIIAIAALSVDNSHAMEKRSYKYHEQPKVAPAIVFVQNMVDDATRKILDAKINQSISLQLDQLPMNIAEIISQYPNCLERTRILEELNLVLKKVPTNNLSNGSSRIQGAQLINRCACENNLSLRATEQQSYIDPKGAFWIIAPRIKPSTKPFSLRQMKDIYKLAKLTGYFGDLFASNIFNTEEGNAFAIDTEEKCFVDWDISEGIASDLKNRFSTFSMEPMAQEWVNKKIAKIAEIQSKRIADYAKLQSEKAEAENKLKAEIPANEAQLKESIQRRNDLSKQEDY